MGERLVLPIADWRLPFDSEVTQKGIEHIHTSGKGQWVAKLCHLPTQAQAVASPQKSQCATH